MYVCIYIYISLSIKIHRYIFRVVGGPEALEVADRLSEVGLVAELPLRVVHLVCGCGLGCRV